MKYGVLAAEPGFYRAFFTASIYTGARVGELTGLTWNDIDLDAGTLRIRRSVSWARLKGEKREQPRLYEPKTDAGKRTLELGAELLAALRRWKLQCPPTPEGLVFPSEIGTPKHRSVIARQGSATGAQEGKVAARRHPLTEAHMCVGVDPGGPERVGGCTPHGT